jgi:hypothetical protein
MWGDQLSRRWQNIRAIEARPKGLPISEVAKREGPGLRTISLLFEDLQAVRFPLITSAYLNQFQSVTETYLRKRVHLRVWLNGGILSLVGLCHLTEEVKMCVLVRR